MLMLLREMGFVTRRDSFGPRTLGSELYQVLYERSEIIRLFANIWELCWRKCAFICSVAVENAQH